MFPSYQNNPPPPPQSAIKTGVNIFMKCSIRKDVTASVNKRTQHCPFSSELSPKLVLTPFFLLALNSRWLASFPFLFLGLFLFSPLLLLLLLSPPQAQNTQQTGFKGNLRLLVKTLEQPHLPFKILPAALSHCLHSDCLLMLCRFHCSPSCSPRIPGEGGHTAEVI